MELSKQLEEKINSYCKLNEISNIGKFIEDLLVEGLNKKMYGTSPMNRFKMESGESSITEDNLSKILNSTQETTIAEKVDEKPKRTRKKVTIIKKNKE